MIPEVLYFSPKTISKALALLNTYEGAKVLAGGTDVITGFHQGSSRFAQTRALIDINKIAKLKKISKKGASAVIGSACTFTQLTDSPLIRKRFPLLAQAASGVGSLQIRNRATIAGNFVNNAPCADSVPALLVYDAVLRFASADGERSMPLSEFLLKPYKTQLGKNELVTAIELPLPPASFRGSFVKVGRRQGVAISRITLSVFGEITDGRISALRLAAGAVTPIGMRFFELEQELIGREANESAARAAALKLGELIHAATGVRWSTPYKLPVVQQVCYQELSQLFTGRK